MEQYSYQFNVKIVGMPLKTENEKKTKKKRRLISAYNFLQPWDLKMFHYKTSILLIECQYAERLHAQNAIICKFVRIETFVCLNNTKLKFK
jgi:hypothetical protein